MPSDNQPYIYATPSHNPATHPYSGFDPKAVTRASLVPPAARHRPHQDGPLLNFNRHPDSYVVGTLPYGLTDAKPMRPSTKKAVKTTRWVQLAMRILTMIGALGMLVCVICIQNTQSSESYIIRVPASIDILTTAYAIYHLFRAAKSRTAASSASYHFFALVIDIGLIPFYVFIALLAKTNMAKPAHDKYRWQSFFDLSGTDKVLLSTWLDSMVVAGMHLISAVISLVLLILFRKIANLPPDMNPLEDNLTSRRKSKHKHKSSELSKSSISAPMTDSMVSLSKSGRSSPTKDGVVTEVQPISFFHTRNHSDSVYSPHNPNTAQYSRSSLAIPKVPSLYSQPRSERQSRANLSTENVQTMEPAHDRTETLKSDKTMMTSSSVYTMDSESAANTPPLPRKSSKRLTMLSDNWFVHRGNRAADENDGQAISDVEEDVEDADAADPYNESTSAFSFGSLRASRPAPYQPVRQHSDYADDPRGRPAPPPKDDGFHLAPLGMHPPTPPPQGHRSNRGTPARGGPRPLGPASGNVNSNCVESRGANPPSPSPSKSRYYGDLSSAMAGIRSSPGDSPTSRANNPRRSKSKYDSGVDGLGDDWQKRRSDGPYAGVRRQDFAPGTDGRGRVISRSGADITDERDARFYDYGDDGMAPHSRADVRSAGLRGRNVSGKVAEEGRGGQWYSRW